MFSQVFPGFEISNLYNYLLLLLVASLRIGSFLVASPFFGSRMIPLQIRIILSIALGFCLVGFIKFPELETLRGAYLIPIIFQEIFLGLVAGMIVTICFSVVLLAGELIATTSGLAFASQIDPASGAQSPVISQIFSLFLLLMFFSVNGHLMVFEIIIQSFELIPIGALGETIERLMVALKSSEYIHKQAVLVALPIVSILLMLNVGIGFITKSAPQLNLFSFGFPLTILGTFFVLFFSVDALQFAFKTIIQNTMEFVSAFLGEL